VVREDFGGAACARRVARGETPSNGACREGGHGTIPAYRRDGHEVEAVRLAYLSLSLLLKRVKVKQFYWFTFACPPPRLHPVPCLHPVRSPLPLDTRPPPPPHPPPHVLLAAEKKLGRKRNRAPNHSCRPSQGPPSWPSGFAVVAVRDHRRRPGRHPGSPPSGRHRRPGSSLPSGIVVRAAIPGRLHPVTASVQGRRRGCRGEQARADGSAAGTPVRPARSVQAAPILVVRARSLR
jgi:hypothetical protein